MAYQVSFEFKKISQARIRPRIKLKIKELERRENRGFETDFHF